MRSVRRSIIHCIVGLALVLSARAAGAQTLDHFTCYKTRTTSGTPLFMPRPGVRARDAFGSSTLTVKRPKLLCLPTDANGSDPTAPSHADHLEDYQSKPATRFAPRLGTQMVDQFGTLILDLRKPLALQV